MAWAASTRKTSTWSATDRFRCAQPCPFCLHCSSHNQLMQRPLPCTCHGLSLLQGYFMQINHGRASSNAVETADLMPCGGDRAAAQVHDIEDLAKIGKRNSACPYFVARHLADSAELVFCPYSYLLDPNIRRSTRVRQQTQAREGCGGGTLVWRHVQQLLRQARLSVSLRRR